MKGILTSALGVTLSLLTLNGAAADDIEWRAAAPPTVASGLKKVDPITPKVAAPVVEWTTPAKQVVGPNPDGTVWRTVRGQSPEDKNKVGELPLPQRKEDPLFPSHLPEMKSETKQLIQVTGNPVPESGGLTGGKLFNRANVVVQPQPFGSPEIRLVNESILGLDPLTEGYSPKSFVSAEYLMWWVTPAKIPALATTNQMGGQPILGNPGTLLLLGPDEVGEERRSGARFRAGCWLDECHASGIDASFFFLGPVKERFNFNSDQFPIIGRPFFAPNVAPDVGLPGQFIETVAFPGISTGNFEICYESFLFGGDINFRECLFTTCDTHAECFIGYRYLNLDESLEFKEMLVAGPMNMQVPAGSMVNVQDRFHTNSQFHGVQVGTSYERYFNRLVVNARASVAVGANENLIEVEGTASLQQPGVPLQVAQGGLLALNSNIGRRTENEFSVVPEVTFNFGYQMTDRFRMFTGYNFMYWTNVVRPGDQIDTVVDVTRVPFFLPPGAQVAPFPSPRPAPIYSISDFWAMGLNFGFEYRW